MLMVAPIGPLSSKKLAAKLRSPASPSALPNDGGSTEARRPSEAAIDPLSQVIHTHQLSTKT
jgi:WD repeat-containing protein 44